MIEINQLLILGIFILLWGIFALIKPKSAAKPLFGLMALFMGTSLIIAPLTTLTEKSTAPGEFFFVLSLFILAGWITVLLISMPSFDSADLSLTLVEEEASQVALKGFGEMLGLIKKTNQSLEYSGFVQQIFLIIFFLVLLLLFKLA